MPSTVVHVGLGFVLAVGLLGRYYDRRTLAVVVGILLLPELDTATGLVLEGTHRALLHNFVLVAVAAGALYWDTNRPDSWLRGRVGTAGIRVLWVGLFVHVFAHLALDWSHLAGINLFYPISDRFFNLDGEMYLSTVDGFVQTFVDVSTDPETGQRTIEAGQGGTTRNTHVASPVDPSSGPEPATVDRQAPIAVQGWQLYLVVAGAFAVVAKHLQTADGVEREEAR